MARSRQRDNPFVEADSVERLRAQAEAVLWVRKQMAQHGLTLADLIAAGCFEVRSRGAADKEPGRAAQYRSADGRSWDGEGDMPDWLQRAVNAGQSAEHFRIG
nr:H-NS family nucleoid-associated regulatory protein [Ralstonia sp. LMG 19083]